MDKKLAFENVLNERVKLGMLRWFLRKMTDDIGAHVTPCIWMAISEIMGSLVSVGSYAGVKKLDLCKRNFG